MLNDGLAINCWKLSARGATSQICLPQRKGCKLRRLAGQLNPNAFANLRFVSGFQRHQAARCELDGVTIVHRGAPKLGQCDVSDRADKGVISAIVDVSAGGKFGLGYNPGNRNA